ncbi:MAG: hypothetical protein HY690_14590 [Chloroflexi bacterium]|nr:hypothetical protein [Chloroflexota bacterium]
MARGFAALEAAARSCCHEILERSGVDWPNLGELEQPLFTSLVQNAHAWVQDVTAREARQTGLDPVELLGMVIEQLHAEHGWDVGIFHPWLLYTAGSCRTCGLAMPLTSLGGHLRRCLGDERVIEEWRRTLN